MAQEFFSTEVPSVYQRDSFHFTRKTGTKSRDYKRILPTNNQSASWNATNGQENNSSIEITFTDNLFLGSNWYNLSDMELLITGKVVSRHNNGAFTGNAAAAGHWDNRAGAFSPESLFTRGYLKIGSTELKSGQNTNMEIGNHLKKLFQYTPEHLKNLNMYEGFYPDEGLDARCDAVPFDVFGTVVTEDGQTANYISVGNTAAADSPQPGAGVKVSRNVANTNPYGNSLFRIKENPTYNPSFVKRHDHFGTTSKTFVYKLRDLFDCLDVLPTVMQGFPLEVRLNRNDDYKCFQYAGDPIAANAGEFPKFYIEKIELQIPQYTPQPDVELSLKSVYNSGTVSRRKFVDKEIHIHTTPIAAGTTSHTREFLSAIQRRPLGVLAGYRLVAETNASTGGWTNYNGNIFRFLNIKPSSASATLGGNIVYPVNGIRGNGADTNYIEFYREMLSLLDYNNQTKFAPILNYEMFATHKFFIPFDFRDIDESSWVENANPRLKIEVNHDAIPIIGAVSTFGVAAGTNAESFARGSPIGGDVELVLIVFTEKEVIVSETVNGVSVQYDVSPLQ